MEGSANTEDSATADSKESKHGTEVSGIFESPNVPSPEPSETPTREDGETLDQMTKTKHPKSILRKGSTTMSAPMGVGPTIRRARTRTKSEITVQTDAMAALHRDEPQKQQTPTPLHSVIPADDTLLFPPQTAVTLSPQDGHETIRALESRLSALEAILGGLEKKGQTEKPQAPAASEDADPLVNAGGELADAGESQTRHEWRREVTGRFAKSSLSVKLKHLQTLANSLVTPKLLDFEKKHAELRAWMENDHSTASQILLSIQAKKLYLLENEPFLRDVADQLKELEELKQYVNSPNLTGLNDYHKRLSDLESNGYLLSEQITELNDCVHSLTFAHSSAMQSVFQQLRNTSDSIAKAKLKKPDSKPPRHPGRGVLFAVQ